MRPTALIAFAIVALAGCATPRDRACRALVLAADECDAARAWSPAKVSPGVSPIGVVAARSEAAGRWVRDMEKPDPLLRAAADTLADAMDRRAAALRRIASASVVFRAEYDPDAGAGFAVAVSSRNPIAEVAPHVEVLLRRCGIGEGGFGQDTPAAFPECAELTLAAKTCMTPGPGLDSGRPPSAGRPGVSVRDHLAHCAAELSAVRSSDAATQAALDALVVTLRDLAPAAGKLVSPAEDVFAAAREAAAAAARRETADRDAARAANAVREACSMHTSR